MRIPDTRKTERNESHKKEGLLTPQQIAGSPLEEREEELSGHKKGLLGLMTKKMKNSTTLRRKHNNADLLHRTRVDNGTTWHDDPVHGRITKNAIVFGPVLHV